MLNDQATNTLLNDAEDVRAELALLSKMLGEAHMPNWQLAISRQRDRLELALIAARRADEADMKSRPMPVIANANMRD